MTSTSHRGQPRSRRMRAFVSTLFGLIVMGLLVWAANKVDWSEVKEALLHIPSSTLVSALAIGALSHIVYATYDLIGRAWTGHRLPWQKVMQVTFVSYAFNLNLGALVGGFAFRFRLYTQLGLRKTPIAKILALSMATNWLGYATLAGAVLVMGWLTPPPSWPLSALSLQWLGAVLWMVVLGYVGACAVAKQRRFTVRGHHLTLPPLRLALLQCLVSSVNWLLMAGMVWVLLQREVPFPHVLGALLAAAVAGVVTHVPAGVGVLEGVFVALLSPSAPASQLLAALLAYRAIYYLLPLALATGLYVRLEARSGHPNTTRAGSV